MLFSAIFLALASAISVSANHEAPAPNLAARQLNIPGIIATLTSEAVGLPSSVGAALTSQVNSVSSEFASAASSLGSALSAATDANATSSINSHLSVLSVSAASQISAISSGLVGSPSSAGGAAAQQTAVVGLGALVGGVAFLANL